MRWISSLILATAAAAAMAQAPFTIVRPADGAKVREKVRVVLPKNSVPPDAYVGVFLDGRLIEATIPPVEGKYRVYTLDTKGRGIPDTAPGKPLKLELVLYSDKNDQAKIIDRSSVDLNIANKANIPVPNRGLALRYRFVPGTEMVYNLNQKVIFSSITEKDREKGGKAAEQDVDAENIRLLFSVDNAYSNGDALLRLQALPEKGKDYADLTTQDDLTQKRYYSSQMASIYMRISNVGREVFAALPPYVPLEGSASNIDPLNLFAVYPLPILPNKNVRPGDSYPSAFLDDSLDLSKYPNIDKVTTQLPARGEFIETEWERGHPCAKLRNTIEVADLGSLKKKQDVLSQGAATGKIDDDKISLTETIWFALDTKKVIKTVRDITIDRKTQSVGGFPGMGGGGGAPAGGPGAGGGPSRGGSMGTGGGKSGGGVGAAGWMNGGTMRQAGGGVGGKGGKGGFGPQGGFGPGGPGGFGPGGPGGFGRQGGFGAGQGGGQDMGATFVRVRIVQTFTLEK